MSKLKGYILLLIFSFLIALQPAGLIFAAPDAETDTFSFGPNNQTILASNNDGFNGVGFGCSISSVGEITAETDEDNTCNGNLPLYYFVHDQGGEVGIIRISYSDAFVESTWGVNLQLVNEPPSSVSAAYGVFVGNRIINGNGDEPVDISISTEGIEDTVAFDDACRSNANALAWVLCPVAEMASDAASWAIGLIYELLHVDPLVTTGSSSNVTYSVWMVFRTIANSLLVVAFLILIYMQLSGNKAYEVQKTLPRLVVIAVLIQVSYFIAAIIVDVGTILAAGIESLLDNVIRQAELSSVTSQIQQFGEVGSEFSVTEYNVGEAIGIGIIYAFMSLIGVFLLVFTVGFAPLALFLLLFGFAGAALIAVIILAARHLAITLMVALAPIAFLLGVFPQTDKYMKEWFDNFIKLIMVYPLAVLVLGVSGLLSLLALESSNGAVQGINIILATLLPAIALFSIPVLFRFSGGLFRAISNGFVNMERKAVEKAKGDPRNPNSLSGRAARQRLANRSRAGARTNAALASKFDVNSKWHPAAIMSRSIQNSADQREYYAAMADYGKGRFSTLHKDSLHGFFLRRGTMGHRGALQYEPSGATRLARYGENKKFTLDGAHVLGGPGQAAIALAKGGHPDYALAIKYGNLDNAIMGYYDGRGERPHHTANEFDAELSNELKAKHMYGNAMKYKNIRAIREAYEAEHGAESATDDIMTGMIFQQPLDKVYEAHGPVIGKNVETIRGNMFHDSQGGLTEQQSANTFEFYQSAIEDMEVGGTIHRFLVPARDEEGNIVGNKINKDNLRKVQDVLAKGRGMSMKPMYRNAMNMTDEQLSQAQQQEREALAQQEAATGEKTPDEVIQSTYRNPADLRQQAAFAQAAEKSGEKLRALLEAIGGED